MNLIILLFLVNSVLGQQLFVGWNMFLSKQSLVLALLNNLQVVHKFLAAMLIVHKFSAATLHLQSTSGTVS